MNTRSKDFALFQHFSKCLIFAGIVIEKDHNLKRDAKMHFNRIMAACRAFEKALSDKLGPEGSEREDTHNSALFELIYQLHHMPEEESMALLRHIQEFEFK